MFRVETIQEVFHGRRLSRHSEAQRARHPRSYLLGPFAPVREPYGAVALGEAPTVRAEHERDVGEGGLPQAEEAREQDLARRRIREVRAPHDLAYFLAGIVDHDGELVSGRSIVSSHDEVVNHLLGAPQQTILEGYANIFRTDSERRRSSCGLAFRTLGSRQFAAGARISVRSGDAVWR